MNMMVIALMATRIKRTQNYRNNVFTNWSFEWWSFILSNDTYVNYAYISSNPNLIMKIVDENPDKPWDLSVISKKIDNENKTSCKQESTSDFFKSCLGILTYIDAYAYINITKQPEELTELHTIKSKISVDIIKQYGNIIWNWEAISADISIDEVINNPLMDWNWQGLSRNPNLTLNFIETHIDKPWSWHTLSSHPVVSMQFIEQHPETPWSYRQISKNPNLTLNFVKQANILLLLQSGNIFDYEYIVNFQEFKIDNTEFIIQEYSRYLAAYRIQQWWHRIRLDPRHPVGMRRLEREYAELCNSFHL